MDLVEHRARRFWHGGATLQVVIIGNGVAGITCALELRKRKPDWKIKVISGESDYFFSRPALMYIYMGHMRFEDTKPYEDWVWAANRIDLVRGWVTGVDVKARRVELDGRSGIGYDKLLIATGSVPNKFGWPGQGLERVSGMVSLQDLANLERITTELKHAVIVGGGLIGVELAEMLHSRGVGVTMLAREGEYWNNALPNAEARMVGNVIKEAGIDLRLASELKEILDDGRGRACGVVTGSGDRIDCQFVGLTAGVRPNLKAVEGSYIETGRGLLVDRSMRTSAEDVFAAGDCAEIKTEEGQRNIIEALWYTARMHGAVAAAVMAGEEKTYDRGVRFNSAKFVDLEWHTYGRVSSAGMGPVFEGEKHLYWEHPDHRHCLRIVHVDGKVKGMNAMGLRHRHRVWERWIAEEAGVDHVLDRLGEANFDPEFFARHEPEIRGTLKESLQ